MICFTDHSFEKLFGSRIIGSKIWSKSKMIHIRITFADVYQKCKKFGFKGLESNKNKGIWIRDRFIFFRNLCPTRNPVRLWYQQWAWSKSKVIPIILYMIRDPNNLRKELFVIRKLNLSGRWSLIYDVDHLKSDYKIIIEKGIHDLNCSWHNDPWHEIRFKNFVIFPLLVI